MDKRSYQREATNALFVNNAYTASRPEVAIFDFLSFFSSEDYSSIPLVETCSEVCHQKSGEYAASASAASTALGSATASSPIMERTTLWPGICCQASLWSTCMFEAFSFGILQMFSLSRSVKNTTTSWTALEEEEDDV